MIGYYVFRQHYYYSGELAVEVAAGGLDCAGCDMLAGQYGFEGLYTDPREAARAALNLLDEWQKRKPQAEIKLAFGYHLDLIEPDATQSREALLHWAEAEYANLPKCEQRGALIGDEAWCSPFDDLRYCSERCVERAMSSLQD